MMRSNPITTTNEVYENT